LMWLLLSTAILCNMGYLSTVLFASFEKMSVFMLSVAQMFKDDLFVFILLFSYFMVAFFSAMWVLYPRAGDAEIAIAPQFNEWYEALRAHIEVPMIGQATRLHFNPENWEGLSAMAIIDIAIWSGLYYFYVLVSLILLLNLLIAMLSHTFAKTKEESILKYRIAFAGAVLKLELAAQSFGITTNVGEKKEDGSGYVYAFRSVVQNSEGGGTGGSEHDPFVAPDDGGPMMRLETRLKATEGKLDTLLDMITSAGQPGLLMEKRPETPSPEGRAASSLPPTESANGQGCTSSRIAEQVQYLFRPLRSATNPTSGVPVRPESRRGTSPLWDELPSKRADQPAPSAGSGQSMEC